MGWLDPSECRQLDDAAELVSPIFSPQPDRGGREKRCGTALAARDVLLRHVQVPGEAANDRWLHRLLRRTGAEPGIAAREAWRWCRPLMIRGPGLPA
jgi:hypothetical protein